ncbi:MAG: HAD family hydrolase [Bacillota bacterium]|nr:HAD family hydrolase [Bacillota bacterium]
MIKACIFDMDGTTVNSLNSIAYFANNALAQFGFPPIEKEKYKYLVGNGASVLVKRMIDIVGGTQEDYINVLNFYNSTYDNDFMYLTEPYEGIPEMLKMLKGFGIKTAIVSNKPHSTAKKISDKLFGDKLIDICRGAKEGVPLKPDPTVVVEVMKAFHITSDECLYIGDTAVDMMTGKNAGIYSIGVLWGFRGADELREGGANEITNDPMRIAFLAEHR